MEVAMDVQSKKAFQILPEEIIEEIISRVPVKTVLQLRCLSKLWCSVIGTKRFIAQHLRNSPPASRFIIIPGFRMPKRFVVQSEFCKQFIESLLRNRFVDQFSVEAYVLGCVNGLFCYVGRDKKFIFWNPSTRVTTALPEVKLGPSRFINLGFGFDESTGEFKVFRIDSVNVKSGRGIECQRRVYSSKSNSWKLLKSDDVLSHTQELGIFVCGKLHWATRMRLGSKFYIATFDVKTEAFGKIEVPSQFSVEKRHEHLCLGVLGGCLSSILRCYKFSDCEVEVWVMEEYGVKESWTKVLNLQPPYSLAAPFCTGPNGEILFVYGSYFLAYNPNDNVFRIFGHIPSYSGVYHYVESLVTPH